MPYHHGDLANAAVRETEAMLAEALEGGAAALSLREVARRIGVSHAALYRHFPDRQALLAAVAVAGFARLDASMRRAARTGTEVAGPDDARDRLRRVLDAYLSFTRRNTATFRVMYGPELADRSQFPQLAAAAATTFELLVALISEARAGARARIESPVVASAAAFALAHGLSVLLVNGLLKAGSLGEIPREDIVDAAFELLWSGLVAPA